jgi:hypothetical protein
MDLILLVLVVALIGWIVYIITTKIQMPPGWAATLQILALIVLILWIVSHFIHVPNVLTR